RPRRRAARQGVRQPGRAVRGHDLRAGLRGQRRAGALTSAVECAGRTSGVGLRYRPAPAARLREACSGRRQSDPRKARPDSAPGGAVSPFFVLPRRALLGDLLADLLQGLLPGTDWDVSARRELADRVVEVALGADTYAVHREDLPPGEPLPAALAHGYGA